MGGSTARCEGSMKSRLSELTLLERHALGQVGRIKQRRIDWQPSKPLMRRVEVENIIRARHGTYIPDPEDTDDRGTCLAYIRAAALSLSEQDMFAWARRWAPWARPDEIQSFVDEASKRRHMMSADGVAGMLGVTYAERTALGLKTIGCCDLSKAERKAKAKERKRERDRNQQTAKRKAKGRQDRKSYEDQSLSRQKPWEALNISRRTWERRRVAGLSQIDIITTGDTLASNAADCSPPVPIAFPAITTGNAGRGGVRGPSPRRGIQGAEPHGNGDTPKEHAA